MTPEGLARAAELVTRASLLVASTGAGMSKESGIPTFRDAQEGLWARFDPQQLATEAGFRANPARVWSWYAYRRARIAACAPHAGHRALAQLEVLVPEVRIVTQNIDGLHQRAGSRDVIELHGNIGSTRCIDCGFAIDVDGSESAYADVDEFTSDLEPPSCSVCGGHARPGVVWFGEMLPRDATDLAWELVRRCDVLLVVGTSGMVWPAAELPGVAKAAGAAVIEVNPQPSQLTPLANVFLEGPAGVVLPRLVDAVRSIRVVDGRSEMRG